MGISKLKIPKICPQCGKPFEAKTVTTVYCSHYCIDRVSKARKKQAIEEERTQTLLQENIQNIAEIQSRPYITIAEAVVLFGISKNTMHRLIKSGKVPAVNLGQRLTRVSRAHIEAMFTAVSIPEEKPQEAQPAKLQYNTDECYTIIEAAKKYNVAPSTMGTIVRRSNLPRWQVGKCVYVPKEQIDNIFKSIKL